MCFQLLVIENMFQLFLKLSFNDFKFDTKTANLFYFAQLVPYSITYFFYITKFNSYVCFNSLSSNLD